MNNLYRDLMEQQFLSDNAKHAFYYNLQRTGRQEKHRIRLKTAVIAVCVFLMIPITAMAVESIWGIGIVEVFSGKGKFGNGFEITFPDVTSRSPSDFSTEVQSTRKGIMRITTFNDSWQEAEQELGMTLVENEILSNTRKATAYTHQFDDGTEKPVHCATTYDVKDEQLYRVRLTAAYQWQQMQIQLDSTVTCEHPAIPKEKEHEFHDSGIRYDSDIVSNIIQEQYYAENGIQSTIVTLEHTGYLPTKYIACFATNDTSYTVTVFSRDTQHSQDAKALLIDIIEAFQFER